MKASDLRIGNWVSMSGKNVHMDIRLFHAVIHGFTGYEPKPIPLTEEWLLKFGFKKTLSEEMNNFIITTEHEDSDYNRILITEGVFQYVLASFTDSTYMEEENETVELKHVHQLQNLYYALIGKELEVKELTIKETV